jgi:hypothetical protein
LQHPSFSIDLFRKALHSASHTQQVPLYQSINHFEPSFNPHTYMQQHTFPIDFPTHPSFFFSFFLSLFQLLG